MGLRLTPATGIGSPAAQQTCWGFAWAPQGQEPPGEGAVGAQQDEQAGPCLTDVRVAETSVGATRGTRSSLLSLHMCEGLLCPSNSPD